MEDTLENALAHARTKLVYNHGVKMPTIVPVIQPAEVELLTIETL
jgi:hypothetical protein